MQLRTSNSRGLNEGLNVGVQGNTSLGYPTQVGIVSYVGTAPTMQGTNISNYAVHANVETQTSTSDSIGIYSNVGTVTGGGNRYAAQLQDGSEVIGKVLTCMTVDGKAHWVTPTGGGVSGSGTLNYVAKWTPDGITLGNSLIRDNGTSIGIGASPVANYRMNIETSTQLYGLVAKTSYSAAVNQSYIGINGTSDGASTAGINAGVVGYATGNTNINQGGSFGATSPSSINVGVFAQALGATSNYAIQLNDGTNGLGKVLTCVGVQGEGNWGKVTSTYTTGASGSFVVGAQTITVTNGLITSIV